MAKVVAVADRRMGDAEPRRDVSLSQRARDAVGIRVPSESDEKMPPFCGAQRLCEELRSLTAGGLRGERELSSCIHGGVARTNPRAEERNVEWTAQGHCGPFCY